MNAARHQVTGQDSSLASRVQGAMQQVGGALGLACLVTLALRHAASEVGHGVPGRIAAVHGYVLSFRIGAALLAVGAVLVLVLLERVSTELRSPLAETTPEPLAAASSKALAARRAFDPMSSEDAPGLTDRATTLRARREQQMSTTAEIAIRELDHRSNDHIEVRLLWNSQTNRVSVAVADERHPQGRTR